MVDSDGQVENRVINLPLGLPPSALAQATNYLTARSAGKNLDDVKANIHAELQAGKTELDEIAARIVTTGLAAWNEGHSQLILRGQAHLLNDVARNHRFGTHSEIIWFARAAGNCAEVIGNGARRARCANFYRFRA